MAALAALSVSPPPTSAVEARARTAEVLATLSIEVDVSDLDRETGPFEPFATDERAVDG